MSALELSPVQVRVLGALVEKSLTTPQYYPMTRNALMAACNQKNCRQPVMQLGDMQVAEALRELEGLDLVAEEMAARSSKWRHRFTHQLLLKPETQAVLVTLMLRGPQTQAELRSHAANMEGPDDLEGVRVALEDLADRAQPLVMELPREVGQSQVRYVHLLCPDQPEASCRVQPASAVPEEAAPAQDQLEKIEQRLAALEAQVSALLERL